MHLQNKPAIEARALSWVPGDTKTPLLNQLSFAIAEGERILLTGPSGSGKSTLLRAIAGALQQTEAGSFGGELYVRGRCGLVLQDPMNSMVASNIASEVAFGPENLAQPEQLIRQAVTRAMTDVAMVDFAPADLSGVAGEADSSSLSEAKEQTSTKWQRNLTEISGGEAQRIALASVLSLGPDILLLDEPLSMLDATSAAMAGKAIRAAMQKSAKTSAIVVDHDAEIWSDVITRVLVLGADGSLEGDLSIEAFRSKTKPVLAADSKPLNLARGSDSKPGKILALVGPSGSGKTTELLRLLGDCDAADVGWVPQQAEFTICANSVWATATATVNNLALSTQYAQDLLTQLGLGEQLQQNPYKLSGGELRRLALVSALAHNPSRIFLDEPTVGQDAETWQAVAGVILAARNSGINVTVATHDAALVALADEVTSAPQILVPEQRPVRSGKVSALMALLISLTTLAASFAITNAAVGLVALGSEVALAAIAWRLLPQMRLKQFAPIAIALTSIWLSNALFASVGWGQLGFETATVVMLRVAFFALPSVALARALHPVELAASLVKWFHVPARPAVAAAAALTRLELLQWQWHNLRMTRKLRGFSAGRGPVARSREFAASLFALLVQALRSAGDLAVAMQARAFGEATAKRRTWVKF